MKSTLHALFNQVWQQPMVQLAKVHGCSDVGLRKTCIAFNIPLPPQGHWQRVNYGKGYPKPALPNPDFNPEITMHPVNRERSLKAAAKEKEISNCLLDASDIQLKPISEFTNLHPLTQRIYELAILYEREIKKLTKKWSWHDRDKFEVDLYSHKGRFILDSRDQCFPFIACIPSILRSIKFLDPLFKALEAEGFQLKVFRDENFRYHGKETVFMKDGIQIKARIREGYSRITPKTVFRKDIPKYLISDYEEQYYPNGVLYFELYHQYSYNWHVFKDLKKHKLEDQLPLIFNFILNAPNEIRAEDERRKIIREQENHIREVDEFNRRRAKNRSEQFRLGLEEAILFKQIANLTEFLEILENQSLFLSHEERAITNQWISLVRNYADLNNPVIKRINAFKQIANNPEVSKYAYWMMNKRKY